VLITAAIILHQNSQCKDVSLFLTAKESDAILKMAQGKDEHSQHQTNDVFKISGIFYIDENDWTVWINGIEYSTIGQHPNFSIDYVTESTVGLTLNDGTSLSLSVTATEDSSPHAGGNAVENK
jgi:hypothetical protein